METTWFQRFWRKIRGREYVVRSGYKLVYTGKKYRDLMKDDPELQKEVFVDNEDYDEILYMFGVYLVDPHTKLYVMYNDGSTRRIKIGIYRKHHLLKLIRRILNGTGEN